MRVAAKKTRLDKIKEAAAFTGYIGLDQGFFFCVSLYYREDEPKSGRQRGSGKVTQRFSL